MRTVDGGFFYGRQIKRSSFLTKKEEAELVQRIKAGDLRARDTLVKSYMPYAMTFVRAYAYRHPDHVQDLQQEALIGLMRAIPKFEPSKGRFSTYAAAWIRDQLAKYLQNNSRTVRIPDQVIRNIHTLQKATIKFVALQGRHPTDTELAALCNFSVVYVQDLQVVKSGFTAISMESSTEDGEMGHGMSDILPDTSILNPESRLIAKDELQARQALMEEFMRGLETLPERQRRIIIALNDIHNTGTRVTLRSLAEEYGVSGERIRQIAVDGLKRLLSTEGDKKWIQSVQELMNELELLEDLVGS